MSHTPLVTDIVRGSTVDGPGLRSVVFLKGCPLRCAWCHNPECMLGHVELLVDASACSRCARCIDVCPHGALALAPSGITIDRSRCTVAQGQAPSHEPCHACVDACDRLALRLVGRSWDHDALFELLVRDKPFYDTSGGGVTFSGGEATQYMHWLAPLLERLHAAGIHVALETAGCFDLDEFDRTIGAWVDLLLFDVKLIDPAEHERWTGHDNHPILANLRTIVARGHPQLEPRVPLIPDIVAREDNLLAIADLLRELGVSQCTLLPYNPSGRSKWAQLGHARPEGVSDEPLPLTREQALRAAFEARLRGA